MLREKYKIIENFINKVSDQNLNVVQTSMWQIIFFETWTTKNSPKIKSHLIFLENKEKVNTS